jgi:hypothetical protein
MRPGLAGAPRQYHSVPATQIRNPKPEGRKKAEIRNLKSEKLAPALLLALIEPLPAGSQARLRERSSFAFRISDFGLLSGIGFRVSGFRPVTARGGGTNKMRPELAFWQARAGQRAGDGF